MKVIIQKRTGIIRYILPETTEVVMSETYIAFDTTIVADMNINNAILLENQTPPNSNGALIIYSEEKGYQLYFDYGDMSLPEIKAFLKEQVGDIASEISLLVTKIRLIHDLEPEGLSQLIIIARGVYNTAMADINELTEENIYQWRLRSPELAQLMASFKALL